MIHQRRREHIAPNTAFVFDRIETGGRMFIHVVMGLPFDFFKFVIII